MDVFIKYLIYVNLGAFLLSAVCILLSKKREGEECLSGFRGLIALAGGSLGNLLAFLIFGRKMGKHNMTVNVLSFTSLIIYGVILLALYGPFRLSVEVFRQNVVKIDSYILIYIAVINIITFVMFAVDKLMAVKGKRRIPIPTLLFFSFIGGSVGGIISMYLFRHKTKKVYFSIGMPMILLAQLAVAVFILAGGGI